MKAAEAFAHALQTGLSPDAALSSLPSYELRYWFRIPIEICHATQQLRTSCSSGQCFGS
jgi:hypothetical protein